MPTILEEVRGTLSSPSRRRWMLWRRKSLVERAGNMAGQVGAATGELVERGKEKIAGGKRRAEVQPISGQWSGFAESQIGLSAERAAEAAEAAAAAAERAAGAIEYMGSKMDLLAGRGEVPAPIQAPDGHSGLKVQQEREEEKHGRRTERRASRQERRIAEEAAPPPTSARWFPWALGLSLGLLMGMIGVAYWQRHRLQQLWGQTSQRAQHVTEGIRQRLEASRSASPQTTPSETVTKTSPGTPTFTTFGSSESETDVDRQVNGRVESTSQ